jgi:hypothetical protein
MRTIQLNSQTVEWTQLLALAQQGPLLLQTTEGQKFVLTPAAEFEEEVESLRNSPSFQTFLEDRMKCPVRIPLEEIEREIHEELKGLGWQTR